MRKALGGLCNSGLALLFVLAGWQVTSLFASAFSLSPPLETARTLGALVREGWFLRHLSTTLYETGVAYLLVVLTGLFLGVVLGLSRFWGDVVEPYVVCVYSLPKVLLYPLFLMCFTVGGASKIAFGWFHGIFPLVILTRNAVKDIHPVYVKLARAFHLTAFQTFRDVVLPAALPSIVNGLKLGFNLTLLGVVLGELIASSSGLGYLLAARAAEGFVIDQLLAIVAFLFLLAMLVNGAFAWWARGLSHGERGAGDGGTAA